MSNQQSLKESDINLTSNVLPVNKKDDIILIWFDNCNIDQNIKNQFEQLHDDCLQCFNITELTDSITNIIDKNIFLIISNQYSEETLQLFHDNEKLDSFYIICINKQVYQNQKEYSKLVGVYIEYEQLFHAIRKQIRLVSKRSTIFKTFNRQNKVIRDLEYESVNYLWYKLLRDMLINMQNNDTTSKQEMLDYSRSYYHSNDIRLKEIANFNEKYQSSDAIRWYTKTTTFPFMFVNQALRTENIDTLYNLRYFIVDLCKHLKLVYDENIELYNEIYGEEFVVYRGAKLSDKEIDQLENKINNYVSTNGFLSTSRSRDVAEMFTDNVLFEITINTKLDNIIYADIGSSGLSENPTEEEILFDLGVIFQIKNVTFKDNKWIVSFRTVNNISCLKNKHFELLQEYIKRSLMNKTINNDFLFGYFLYELDYYCTTIEYFKDSFKIFNGVANYLAHFLIAQSYKSIKQYPLALEYAKKAYIIDSNISDNSMARAKYLWLKGTIYLKQNELNNALNYFKEALTIPDIIDLSIIDELHSCVGYVYYKLGNLFYAYKHCRQSLEILNEFYIEHSSDSIAQLYLILGNILFELNGNNTDHLVLEYLQKSLSIKTIIYPNNSYQQFASVYTSIGNIYYHMNKYDWALYNYNKVLELYKQDRSYNVVSDEILFIYEHIGMIYYQQEKFDLACKSFRLIVGAMEKNNYLNDKIHDLYDLLGQCYGKQEQYDESIEYYEKSLKMIESLLPKNKVKISSLYINIGLCYSSKADIISSIKNFMKALEIQEKCELIDEEECARLKILIYGCWIDAGQSKLKLDQTWDVKLEDIIQNIKITLYKAGRYEGAWKICLDSAKKYKETAKYSSIIGENYEVFANIYQHFGEKTLAYNCYVKSLKYLRIISIYPYSYRNIKRVEKSVRRMYHSIYNARDVRPIFQE